MTTQSDPSDNGSNGTGAHGTGSHGTRSHAHHMLAALSQPATTHDSRRFGLDKVVFGVTAVIALAFVVWGFAGTASLGSTSSSVLDWVIHNTGWLFVLTASVFVVFVLWLAASRYGRIPLGHDRERPEFKTVSWVAMMFSAGMGIGLMFFGVAEPLYHYASPPPGTTEPETA